MKCSCGAPSEILETRTYKSSVYRRRICFNGHRFSTDERVRKEINKEPFKHENNHTCQPTRS